MKRKSEIRIAAAALAAALLLVGCGGKSENSDTASDTTKEEETQETVEEKVTLVGFASETPHGEILEFVKPQLEEKGIEIELVVIEEAGTMNEKLENGEIDFHYCMHEPYMNYWNEQNGGHLVNAGSIHLEPISGYSDKYASVDELPDGAVVAVPDGPTNEYRVLKVLEQNGFITLQEEAHNNLSATVKDITEYKKDIEIVEVDYSNIIPSKDDYDMFFVFTSRALQAQIDSNVLLTEEVEGNPYFNIVGVREEDKDNPAIQTLVEVLKSDETKEFIREQYKGAVVPVE